jgi:transcription initiation factor TFIIIB Brf1 subunit/transcription initiation factor TFIIB
MKCRECGFGKYERDDAGMVCARCKSMVQDVLLVENDEMPGVRSCLLVCLL